MSREHFRRLLMRERGWGLSQLINQPMKDIVCPFQGGGGRGKLQEVYEGKEWNRGPLLLQHQQYTGHGDRSSPSPPPGQCPATAHTPSALQVKQQQVMQCFAVHFCTIVCQTCHDRGTLHCSMALSPQLFTQA